MAKKLGKGLGRGLDAIFATENVEIVTDNDKIVEIALDEIKKNPYQPRTYFNEEKLNELKESIEKNGLLQPIIVKKAVKGYYIIAGERRYRAFELLDRKEIPAIIKEMTDEEMMVFAVLENLQREDLSALEESESYKNLMDKMSLTQEELAKKLGKSRPYIANSLRLLKLPTEIKNKLEQGVISTAHARTLLSLKTKKAMEEVCVLVVERKMSVRELEEYVAKLLKPREVRKTKAKDIFIEEQENILKKRLGTSVTIKQGRNKKGKIEIEFKDNDEFERIISLFKDE
ncbi:MAG: ParB/RepB/Spo0J family partition protein [Gemella haemolysans]|uniref:ParB/RepB/Spo0J family partition protein n=1 Tax=Gemella haemolysans TaxID=1379 RepID=UPI0012280F70|nr:ParB/RepB/Spo0J family partition protein [Gemella haemolysans]MBS5318556.1 ParB/RepB/Spo0J family partition protein [Gemella haemolysans]TKW63163.1 MAG: ParB/RepB/Spo0J family partition protein [Gemella sp.]